MIAKKAEDISTEQLTKFVSDCLPELSESETSNITYSAVMQETLAFLFYDAAECCILPHSEKCLYAEDSLEVVKVVPKEGSILIRLRSVGVSPLYPRITEESFGEGLSFGIHLFDSLFRRKDAPLSDSRRIPESDFPRAIKPAKTNLLTSHVVRLATGYGFHIIQVVRYGMSRNSDTNRPAWNASYLALLIYGSNCITLVPDTQNAWLYSSIARKGSPHDKQC